MYQLEDNLTLMKISAIYHQIEVVNNIIIRIMNETIKKVEGMKKNISFSSIKKQWWVNLMYRKMKLQQLKGGKVDEDIL